MCSAAPWERHFGRKNHSYGESDAILGLQGGLQQLKHILEIHTKNMPLKGVNIGNLAKKMEGYTCADIECVVREAAILALRKDTKAKEVSMKHFKEALEQVAPSVTEDTVKY